MDLLKESAMGVELLMQVMDGDPVILGVLMCLVDGDPAIQGVLMVGVSGDPGVAANPSKPWYYLFNDRWL